MRFLPGKLLETFFILTIAACNVYSPLGAKTDTEDYLEEARKCLHNGDYACAVANYRALPDGNLKSEKLCTVYLAKGGVKLSTLVNILRQNSSSMLGSLAQELVPWTETKAADFVEARSACAGFASTNTEKAVLLDTIAKFASCGILMAKTDLFIGATDSDTVCTTAGNADGRITKTDIGNTSGTGAGMCPADAAACADHIAEISSTQLGNAGLTDIANALTQVPAELKSSSTGAVIARTKIRDTAADD